MSKLEVVKPTDDPTIKFLLCDTVAMHQGQIFIPGVVTLQGVLRNGNLNGADIELRFDAANGLVYAKVQKGGAKRTVIIPQSSVNYLILAL